jgi:hypothetical protein
MARGNTNGGGRLFIAEVNEVSGGKAIAVCGLNHVQATTRTDLCQGR